MWKYKDIDITGSISVLCNTHAIVTRGTKFGAPCDNLHLSDVDSIILMLGGTLIGGVKSILLSEDSSVIRLINRKRINFENPRDISLSLRLGDSCINVDSSVLYSIESKYDQLNATYIEIVELRHAVRPKSSECA